MSADTGRIVLASKILISRRGEIRGGAGGGNLSGQKGVIMKTGEELFLKWRSLGSRITALYGIVQNDADIPESQIREWVRQTKLLKTEYKQLVNATLHHLGVIERERPRK